ncbi:hypothetical protein Tco_0419344 [Tanacetum coccineum]
MSPGYISPWHIYSLNENVVGLHNARSEKVAFLRRISWRAFPLSNYPGRHVARDKYPQRHVAPGKAGKCDGIVVNVGMCRGQNETNENILYDRVVDTPISLFGGDTMLTTLWKSCKYQ